MYLIYSFLYILAIIVLFLPEYLKRPKELRSKWLREKFGIINFPVLSSQPSVPSSQFPVIWIHAVSVGEVNASIQLIRKIKSAYPQFSIILSTITDTGQKVAMERAPEGVKVVYLPFDTGFVLNKCFNRIKPALFIVIETELWPNIFRVLSEKGVPVIVLNGRISERSSKGYRKISFFMKKIFAFVKVFGMQSIQDARRLKEIGAEEKKIKVIGNFKFDMSMPERMPVWAENMTGPIIVAGSTHNGEEEIMLSSFQENLSRVPDLKLIIAPRHPERFKEVEEMLKRKGMKYIMRSEIIETIKLTPPNSSPCQGEDRRGETSGFIILLDSIGELSSVYAMADIAIMGKSFLGFGGQNPLEPAYWGKPVLCGPHMENFLFIKEFYAEGAAFEVTQETLAKKIKELLINPDKAKAAGEKAKELCMKNSGAVDRAMEIIEEYIGR